MDGQIASQPSSQPSHQNRSRNALLGRNRTAPEAHARRRARLPAVHTAVDREAEIRKIRSEAMDEVVAQRWHNAVLVR